MAGEAKSFGLTFRTAVLLVVLAIPFVWIINGGLWHQTLETGFEGILYFILMIASFGVFFAKPAAAAVLLGTFIYDPFDPEND